MSDIKDFISSIEDLKKKNSTLEIQIKVQEKTINDLNIENWNLKQQNDALRKEVEKWRQISNKTSN